MCYNAVCHSAEIPYLFDFDKLTDVRFTDDEQELADKLIFYWTNFAKYGDPNQPPQLVRFHPRVSFMKQIGIVVVLVRAILNEQ